MENSIKKHLPKILIVDDLEENLLLLEAILGKMDVRLVKAMSGEEALMKTRDVDFALAILDVRMPLMTGYQLAVLMNAARVDNKIPIIFITAGDSNERDLLVGYQSGAVDYIFKPINSHVLKSKVKVFIDLFIHKQIISQNAALIIEASERLKNVNIALKLSEEKYRSYIDNAPDGVFIADESGRYIEVNEAACRITGYTVDELLKMAVNDLLTGEFSGEGWSRFGILAETGQSEGELKFKHKNGQERWWSLEAVKLSGSRFLIFAKDISDRKIAEVELKSSLDQLRQLTNYIEKVREEERIAISRELHDDLGQALTAVKIDLGLIRRCTREKEVAEKIESVSRLVGETIKTVQVLTSRLRPPILDDLGLIPAVEWFTREFSERTGIQVALQLDSGIALPSKAPHVLFRILQESLTNVARHSGAKRVDISLIVINGYLHFTIADNGTGIEEGQKKSNRSFGILSMTERAASIGGVLQISGRTGHGTELKLVIAPDQLTGKI